MAYYFFVEESSVRGVPANSGYWYGSFELSNQHQWLKEDGFEENMEGGKQEVHLSKYLNRRNTASFILAFGSAVRY